MAESMRGLKRSHRCTEVSNADIGSTVTVMGWVQRRRNLGSLIFIDLRDRSGLLQIVFDENSVGADGFAKAETLRSEYVIAVVGKIQKRSAAVNENLKTGDIEVIAESLRILSESDTPPFHIEENSQTKDEIRLKYRYLDLRRPDLQRNLMLRSKVAYLMRDFMAKEGFIEIETPVLTKSTPEGARDYLVPSRVHPPFHTDCSVFYIPYKTDFRHLFTYHIVKHKSFLFFCVHIHSLLYVCEFDIASVFSQAIP